MDDTVAWRMWEGWWVGALWERVRCCGNQVGSNHCCFSYCL